MHLVGKRQQQQQHVHNSSTSASVSTPAGAYSMTITRHPLVPSSPYGGTSAISVPSPRTPSVHSPGSISRPTSRPPSTASRPSSTASCPPPAMQQGSPAGIPVPCMTSPRGVHHAPPPQAAAASVQQSPGQVHRSSAEEVPLDLSKSTKPLMPPQHVLGQPTRTEVGGSGSTEDPLDLSAPSASRKRKWDDSDDDIICVGVSMPPTVPGNQVPKVPRLAPAMVSSSSTYISPQVYQVHHAQALTPYRHTSQHVTQQRSRTNSAAVASRYGVTARHQSQSQRPGYANHVLNRPNPSARPPPASQSILEEYLQAYKENRKYPPRPTTPGTHVPQRPSMVQGPPGAGGVVRTPSQVPIIQQRQLKQIGQAAYDIQMQKRQQYLPAKQGVQSQVSPRAASRSHQPPGGPSSLVQKSSVPGLSDSNPVLQSNMLKQHQEPHNVQIQGGRMLNHNVVQRPGVVVENKSQGSTGSTGPSTPHPTGGGQQHKLKGNERITYMMASEPVPACATTSATAIEITQQPTFIGAPLMVPNPAGKVISRYNSGIQMAAMTTTTTTTTGVGNKDTSAPGVIKTENQEVFQSNTQTVNSATQPQKHFINTDTQTADLPGDQWHRPFRGIGMPNKNIPIANVNPMVHTKCASPALHPKKQILFQSQSAGQGDSQGELEGSSSEVKSETPFNAEAGFDATRLNQDSISVKPEYSSSHDIKADTPAHEQYLSKIKERLIRKMHQSGDEAGPDGKIKQENKGTLKYLKRKYNRTGKYTAPLMKKAAQAMKRDHATSYHHSNTNQQQQGGCGNAQAHGKPILSKTILDLSDITGESIEDSQQNALARSPHKRFGHHSKASGIGNKRQGIHKEIGYKKEGRTRVKEGKKEDEEYDGETEVENEDNSNNDTEVRSVFTIQ